MMIGEGVGDHLQAGGGELVEEALRLVVMRAMCGVLSRFASCCASRSCGASDMHASLYVQGIDFNPGTPYASHAMNLLELIVR